MIFEVQKLFLAGDRITYKYSVCDIEIPAEVVEGSDKELLQFLYDQEHFTKGVLNYSIERFSTKPGPNHLTMRLSNLDTNEPEYDLVQQKEEV
jgi:hypothetical protein